MFTDQFWTFSSSKFPVLSVYLNRTDNPASISPRLTDILKPIREMASDLDHAAAMSLREDIEAVQGLREKLELDPSPAAAIFACGGEGFFHHEPLGAPARDVAITGPTPYLRPLRAARDTARSAVAVVDRRTARIYMMNGQGTTLEHEIVESEELKSNYGGWHGYEERSARAHADRVASRHFRAAAEALFDIHKNKPIKYLMVGGHREHTDDFVATLHPYLRNLHVGNFSVDPRTLTTRTVTELAAPLERAAIDEQETALVNALLDRAGSGKPTAMGIAEVIAAANVRAIDTLVVSGPFIKAGTVCDACGWLTRIADECPACGTATRPTPDIVAELIEASLRDGGSVRQVTMASRLDADGVGASLRFPLPEGV